MEQVRSRRAVKAAEKGEGRRPIWNNDKIKKNKRRCNVRTLRSASKPTRREEPKNQLDVGDIRTTGGAPTHGFAVLRHDTSYAVREEDPRCHTRENQKEQRKELQDGGEDTASLGVDHVLTGESPLHDHLGRENPGLFSFYLLAVFTVWVIFIFFIVKLFYVKFVVYFVLS